MPRIFMHKMVHFILTLVLLFLAFTFADEVPTFISSISYERMASVMPEHDWAALCGLIGALGLATTFTDNWKIRTFTATVLGATHLGIAILIFLGNKHAIGTGLFLGYGLLGLALAYSTAHLGQRISKDLDPFNIS